MCASVDIELSVQQRRAVPPPSLKLGLLLCTGLLALACSSDKKGGQAGSSAGGTTGAAASGDSPSPGGGKGGSGVAAAGGGTRGGAGGAGSAAPSGGRTGAAQAGRSGGGSGGSTAIGGAGAGGSSVGTTANSVLERNNHASRDGLFVQPTLTKANAMKLVRDSDFKATFTGNMWASPLYLENGPGGKGVFFAVTTANDVLALDETTGATIWKKNLGSSPMSNGDMAKCGSIHPLGIVGTPVIDADTRTIYVAGAIGTSQIDRHEVHALSVDDGMERAGWPVDVTKLSANGKPFEPQPQNQRSALSLVKGIVYVAYGGHVGDCGNYRGWVVGIDTKTPTNVGGWATLGVREGIWAAGGMASDGDGVFAVTGNGGANDRTNSDSEQVVRITGLGKFDRSNKNLYFPTSWKSMDSTDADFGATNPLYVTIPGSTPENYVAAISKDGHVYLLDSTNLGGMAGHKVDFPVANGNMALSSVPTSYTTSSGVHLAFSIGSGAAKCMGGNTNSAIMSLKLTAGSPPTPSVAWCAGFTGSSTGPITTTTDGMSDAIVWYVNGSKLAAVDAETGAAVFTSSDSCNGVHKWASPIAVKGRIVVAADNGLCSWSAH